MERRLIMDYGLLIDLVLFSGFLILLALVSYDKARIAKRKVDKSAKEELADRKKHKTLSKKAA
jgi:hypothetical protein